MSISFRGPGLLERPKEGYDIGTQDDSMANKSFNEPPCRKRNSREQSLWRRSTRHGSRREVLSLDGLGSVVEHIYTLKVPSISASVEKMWGKRALLVFRRIEAQFRKEAFEDPVLAVREV
jgi:hypothetical protein